MRLRDLYTGELTRRELIAYIKHLPNDSALGRATLGEPKATFDQHAALLMQVVNILIAANSEKPDQATYLKPPE